MLSDDINPDEWTGDTDRRREVNWLFVTTEMMDPMFTAVSNVEGNASTVTCLGDFDFLERDGDEIQVSIIS